MTFLYRDENKQTKIDKVKYAISNYEDLESYEIYQDKYNPYSKVRRKNLTDKYLKDGLIDDNFLSTMSCLDITDLLFLKLESMYDHLIIKTNFSVPIVLNKIKDVLVLYKNSLVDDQNLRRILERRDIRKKQSVAKK